MNDATSTETKNNGVSFKKPKKLVGKKRAAEEDIISILESREDDTSGLGTRD